MLEEKISYTYQEKFLTFIRQNPILQIKKISYNYYKKLFFEQIILHSSEKQIFYTSAKTLNRFIFDGF